MELDALELGEQAVAEHLRGDAGAVGDEEHGAALVSSWTIKYQANARSVAQRSAHDRRGAGRRQERLARRDDRPPGRGRHPRARAASPPPREAFREFLAPTASDERIDERLRRLDPSDVEGARRRAARRSARWILEAPFPDGARARDTRITIKQLDKQTLKRSLVRRALLRHGRGPARCLVRRPAGNLPQHPRHRQRAGGDPARLRLALQRPRHLLSRAPGLRRTRAVALSAAVQQMVRSDLGASGVMFTLDTESGFRDVVFITSSYGLGEMVVQGAVNPDEFYVHKPMLEKGKPGDRAPRASAPSCRRWCSAKSDEAGKSTQHRRRARSRARPLLADGRRSAGARALRRARSRSTTAARWTSSGARTAPTAASTSCRRAPRR